MIFNIPNNYQRFISELMDILAEINWKMIIVIVQIYNGQILSKESRKKFEVCFL